MATNLAIDDQLIVTAQKIGHHKTKREAVTEALKEYIQLKKQQKVLNLFGKIDYDADYNYKAQRNLA